MTHDELRQAVALMRKLGVIRWDDVELGPEPTILPPLPAQMSEAEIKRFNRLQDERMRIRQEILDFAASEGMPDDLEAEIERRLTRKIEMEETGG